MKRLWVVLLLAGTVLAEPRRVILLAEVLRLEANRSRSFEFPLAQQKAQLDLSWSVAEGGAPVRMLLLNRQTRETLFDSGYEREGREKLKLEARGEYLLSIENHQQRLGAVAVDTHMALVFGEAPPPGSAAREVPADRRFWTIAISIASFVAMAGFAVLRLGPAVARRLREPRN